MLRAPFARAARARGAGVLDALLHGRGWIALVGVLLAGIVFFNVDLLQMNREIARTAERSAEMKRENARLRLRVARLGSSERIQQAAAERGFVLPAPGDIRYVRSDVDRAARRALQVVTAPDPRPSDEPASAGGAPATAAPGSGAPAAGTPVAAPPAAGAPPATGSPPAPSGGSPPAAATPQATAPPAGGPAG